MLGSALSTLITCTKTAEDLLGIYLGLLGLLHWLYLVVLKSTLILSFGHIDNWC